jgi:RNA polymerase sigma-70 factor (ECF subfamily)
MVEPRVKIQDDQTLIAKAQQGDLHSFDLLVRSYQRRVYSLAYRMVKNHDAADDVAQDTFIKAYSSIESFKLGRPFFTWLYRICMNLSINYLKRQKFMISESQFEEETSPLERETADGDPLSLLVKREQERRIEHAISVLPPKYKGVFVLRVYEDLSYEEIAQTLKISLGTVMSRLFRARERLQKLLKDVVSDK